jgi:hypothetical protein
MRTTPPCIKKTITLMTTLSAGVLFALELPSGGALIFNLDATAPDPQLTLAGATVLGWGPFALMQTNSLPPVLTTAFGGVPAVRFYDTGDSHLRSTEATPATVTGGSPYTIEAWAFTPNFSTLGELISWGDDTGAGSASLGYGTDVNQGAVRHGNDNARNLGYIGLPSNIPATNQWHHLAVTYSGSTDGQQRESLYVDGMLLAGQANLSLNVEAGTRFHLGTLFRPAANTFIQRYNGAIARVRLHSGVLSPAQIAANYNEEAPAFGCSALGLTLNAFEGTGAWADTAHWSQQTLPETGHFALVNGHAEIASPQTADELHVAGTLTLAGGGALLQTANAATVGYGAGALRVSDGATFISGASNTLSLVVGFRRGGSLSVTNATLIATNGLFAVGHATQGIGTAELVNADSRFQNVSIGNLVTSASGLLHVENGNLQASGTFYIGDTATGRMIVDAADVTIGNTFVAGRNTGGRGTYEQRGGTLTFTRDAVVGSGGSTNNPANGAMMLTDVLLACTNSNFTVANAVGTLAATNCTLRLTDFNVANPVGGAKGNAEVVDSFITARDITSANNSNAIGSLMFENCTVTSRTIYVGRKYKADGWLGLSRSCVTSAAFYIGETAASRGTAFLSESTVTTLTFNAGYNAGATGTVTLASGTLDASSHLYAGYNGHGVFSNLAGLVRSPTLGVSFNSATASGYLYHGPAARIETSNVLQVGRYGTGMLDCFGSIHSYGTSGLYIGNLANAEGVFNLYPGGAVSVQQTLVLGFTAGTGTFNQYGGETRVSNAVIIAGNGTANTAAVGFLNLHGGTFICSNAVFVSRGGTGVLHVAGGILSIPAANSLTIGLGTSSHGTCILSGGRIVAGHIKRDNGIGGFYFDGGTLSPAANQSDFIRNLTKAEIRPGGAIIDTAGFNATIAHPVAHDSRDDAPAKDGGLTKLGDGTLTMTGALGFTGDLGADGGTLNLAAAAYALSSGSGLWGSGRLVPPASGFGIPADGWIAPGSTNGVGTLTVDGNLTVNGEIRARVGADGSACNTLAVTGSLIFPAGSTLAIQNPEKMERGVSYTFVTAASISGTPATANLPAPWKLNTRNNQLRAVYNSGTLISLQ